METLSYSLEDLSDLGRLHIEEQNLDIALDPRFSIFHSKGDMHVIIGYETDHTFYNHDSQLVCGIVEIKKGFEDGDDTYLEKLILPFSSQVLFAKFLDDKQILVAFKNEGKICKRVIELHDEIILNEDMNLILDDSYPLVMPLGDYHKANIKCITRK